MTRPYRRPDVGAPAAIGDREAGAEGGAQASDDDSTLDVHPVQRPARMTAAERGELGKLVRLRAKVAKDDVAAMAAKRLADVERELAAQYSPHEQAWSELVRETRDTVKAADAELQARCKALGIRPEFRPSINFYFSSRGENAIAGRRAELRRVAQSEIESRIKTARVEIDRMAARQLTELASGALSSGEARAFLESMPTIDALLPPLVLKALEEMMETAQRR